MKSLYLVAYYYQKPKSKRVRTNQPGWQQRNDAVSWDEQVQVTSKLKNRDLTMAGVILDLPARRVVRNSWKSEKDFTELFEYYRKNYPDYVEDIAMKLYAATVGQNDSGTANAPINT